MKLEVWQSYETSWRELLAGVSQRLTPSGPKGREVDAPHGGELPQDPGPDLDPALDSLGESPRWLAFFDGHDHPFVVHTKYCQNPTCDCRDATFTLRECWLEARDGRLVVPEVDGEDNDAELGSAELLFDVIIDLTDGKVMETWPAGAVEHPVVQEFCRDLSASSRREVRRSVERFRSEKRQQMASAAPSAADVENGQRATYCTAIIGQQSILDGGRASSWNIDLGGQHYAVDDEYCTDPRCDCRQGNLVFLKMVTEPGSSKYHWEDACQIEVGFDGEIATLRPERCSKKQARALHAAWQEAVRSEGKDPGQEIAARYSDIKKLGEKTLAARPAQGRSQPLRRQTRKVGRNEPCPCGSGKKYKKCCLK